MKNQAGILLVLFIALTAVSAAGLEDYHRKHKPVKPATIQPSQPMNYAQPSQYGSEKSQSVVKKPIRILVDRDEGKQEDMSRFSSSSQIVREDEGLGEDRTVVMEHPEPETEVKVAVEAPSESELPSVRPKVTKVKQVRRRQNITRAEVQERKDKEEELLRGLKEMEEAKHIEEDDLVHQYSGDEIPNINYSYSSSVKDGIRDGGNFHSETREANVTTGTYSYSDGYFNRTVHYIADDGGFRILSDIREHIGDGPKVDLVNGKAHIQRNLHGIRTEYSISAADIKGFNNETSTATEEVPVRESDRVEEITQEPQPQAPAVTVTEESITEDQRKPAQVPSFQKIQSFRNIGIGFRNRTRNTLVRQY